MEIRPVRPPDLDRLIDIDGTIESTEYLHIDRLGEGTSIQWKIEPRPLRQKRVNRNRPTDESNFRLRQVVAGVEDGIALLAEHDGINVALLVASEMPESNTLHIHDLFIDFEYRRQGVGSAMVYRVIQEARDGEMRAVSTQTLTDNAPAAKFLLKCGFDLSGLDSRRNTNHDLVKETVTLFWYAALD